MRTLFLSQLCVAVLTITTFHSSAFASDKLSAAEANTVLKEDIAGTQVLSETCPALIGKQAKFDQNIQKLIQTSLKEYAGATMTFAALQNDAEYKSILAEAHKTLKETAADEQKTVCEDVLNYQE